MGRLPGRRFKESGVEERREKVETGRRLRSKHLTFSFPSHHFSAAGIAGDAPPILGKTSDNPIPLPSLPMIAFLPPPQPPNWGRELGRSGEFATPAWAICPLIGRGKCKSRLPSPRPRLPSCQSLPSPDPINKGPGLTEGAVPPHVTELCPSLGQRPFPPPPRERK